MSTVRRYDRSSFRPPVRTDAGFLRVDAYLTRVGVFEYARPDGTIRRELRLPEEVFRADSLDSLQAAPLTLEHPDKAVTPENVADLMVGSVGTDVRQDGEYIRSTVMVHDAKAIRKVDSGEMRELSCGYDATLDETPGEWNGQRYDAIQRSITYNHLAIVPKGRAGPDVRLHLDAADAVMVAPQSAPNGGRAGDNPMKRKIQIGKRRFDVDEEIADSIEEEIKAKEDELEQLKAERDKAKEDAEKAEAAKDEAEKKAEDAEQEKQDALKPEKIRDLVQARVALQTQAASILGAETKLDAMSDLEVKHAVIAKLHPEAKLDGKSEVYVQARYDAAIETLAARPSAGLAKLRQGIQDAQDTGAVTAEARRDAMLAKTRDAWKAPIMGAKKGAA